MLRDLRYAIRRLRRAPGFAVVAIPDLDVVRLVGRRVAIVISLGLLLGVAAHLALGRWLAGLLYGVELLDPGVLAVAATALVVTSLLAGITPVRRAVSIDPMSTLREE